MYLCSVDKGSNLYRKIINVRSTDDFLLTAGDNPAVFVSYQKQRILAYLKHKGLIYHEGKNLQDELRL